MERKDEERKTQRKKEEQKEEGRMGVNDGRIDSKGPKEPQRRGGAERSDSDSLITQGAV